jgi:hypothetical protein
MEISCRDVYKWKKVGKHCFKRCLPPFIKLHSVTSQQAKILTVTAVKPHFILPFFKKIKLHVTLFIRSINWSSFLEYVNPVYSFLQPPWKKA